MNRQELLRALPTLFTLGNLACGLAATAIAAGPSALPGATLDVACGLVLLALLLDGIDGVVARRLGVASRFGRHLDSLADMVSFGVAPSMLIVTALELPLPVGWAAALVYLGAVAVRLARFVSEPTTVGFRGMPSPAAAMMVVGLVPMQFTFPIASAVLLSLPILMLSRIEFRHPASLGSGAVVSALAVAAFAWWAAGSGPTVLLAAAAYSAWAMTAGHSLNPLAHRRLPQNPDNE